MKTIHGVKPMCNDCNMETDEGKDSLKMIPSGPDSGSIVTVLNFEKSGILWLHASSVSPMSETSSAGR